MPKPLMQKQCSWTECQLPFETNRHNQRFCSPRCSYKYTLWQRSSPALHTEDLPKLSEQIEEIYDGINDLLGRNTIIPSHTNDRRTYRGGKSGFTGVKSRRVRIIR
jgi:hypothetical protein